jgi:hypothetical protein
MGPHDAGISGKAASVIFNESGIDSTHPYSCRSKNGVQGLPTMAEAFDFICVQVLNGTPACVGGSCTGYGVNFLHDQVVAYGDLKSPVVGER